MLANRAYHKIKRLESAHGTLGPKQYSRRRDPLRRVHKKGTAPANLPISRLRHEREKKLRDPQDVLDRGGPTAAATEESAGHSDAGLRNNRPELLFAQDGHGIDSQSTTCRQDARNKGNNSQQENYASDHYWIKRPNTIDLICDRLP